MNKMKILVTFANVWKMDTGNSGMTLNYFMFGENGELMNPEQNLSGGAVGQQRAKCSVPENMRDKITWVPGIKETFLSLFVSQKSLAAFPNGRCCRKKRDTGKGET